MFNRLYSVLVTFYKRLTQTHYTRLFVGILYCLVRLTVVGSLNLNC